MYTSIFEGNLSKSLSEWVSAELTSSMNEEQPPRSPSILSPRMHSCGEIGWGAGGSERLEGGEAGCQHCLETDIRTK